MFDDLVVLVFLLLVVIDVDFIGDEIMGVDDIVVDVVVVIIVFDGDLYFMFKFLFFLF